MAQKEKIALKKRILNLSITTFVSLLIILASFTKFYEITEFKLYDSRFQIRGPLRINPHIATIDIDGATLQVEGRFQDWTRDKHARIVESVYEMGARLIGFDIYFPEPSERFLNLKDLRGDEDFNQNQMIPKETVEMKFPDHDEDFAEALRNTQIGILGQSFKLGEFQDSTYIRHNTIIPSGDRLISLEALKQFSIEDPNWLNTSILKYVEIEPPIKKLVDASRGVSFAMTVADIDGSVRRYPVVVSYNGRLYPALALMMLSEYIGVDVKDIIIEPGRFIEIPEGTLPDGEKIKIKIPIDEKGRMLVNWAGSWNEESFLHISYSAALRFSVLIQQDMIFKRIKELYHKDNSLFNAIDEESGEIKEDVMSSFMTEYEKSGKPVTDNVIDLYFRLIMAVQFEEEIHNGVAELSEEIYPPEMIEIFNKIKNSYHIAEHFKENKDLTLQEMSQKLDEPNFDNFSAEYYILKNIFNNRELEKEDYPLYFLTPVIGSKILNPEDFQGKIFFYGLTAAGTWDLNPMPYMDRYPMLGLHANAFNTMLEKIFLNRFSKFGNILIMLGLGLLIGLIVPTFKPLHGAVIMVVFSIGYLVAAQYLFQSHGLWIDVLGPVAILIFGYTSATVYNFFSEEQEKKMIRGIFSRYVTKSVVDELIKNPDMVKLGGEKKELTVFFSDVAGFTTISERLTPEELVALLNEYLTAMTNIVLSYDGMIDKYEGDAIMAVFGAPIPYKDHPTRACYVSLDMQKELIDLRKKWKEEGKPELYVRIGLNTGPMVVGNMGAADRLDYTVMGDSVNLGARLEGANKAYGTQIMISEFTYKKCKNDIESRFLDLLRVKGKELPVTVYEVLAKKDDGLTENKKKVVEIYNTGIEYYRKKEWGSGITAFEEALSIDPDDGPSKVYLERCRQYKITPPPDDWDGVFIMTTK